MRFEIVKFFNQLGRGTRIDAITDAVSRVLYLSVFWTVATMIIFFFAPNGKVIATAMVISEILHFALTEGIFKRLSKRVRPYMAFADEIFPIGRKPDNASFPSSHMSANLSVLTVVAYFYPSIILPIIIWVIIAAFARLHNGMHYLSDVVAGIILGILYGTLAIYLVNSYHYVLS